MNIFLLSARNLVNKPLTATLNIALFVTGIFIISLILSLKQQFEGQLERNIAGVDLVVGAKGSPLQLILSSVYQVDYPTGNILLEEAQKLNRNPLIKKTIPLAMGDSYSGYRIVGTNSDYAALYNGSLKEGSLWNADFEVTIGSKVAEKSRLKIGDTFSGIHGYVEESSHSHDEFKYRIVGIFNQTGSVLDQLILTNIESVWAVHSGHDHSHPESVESDEGHEHPAHSEEEHIHSPDCGHDDHEHTAECTHHHEEDEESPREITSLFVFFKNPMGAVSLPRQINKNTNMQAASPVMEINRLFSLMGGGVQTISLIAALIMVISGFSIFISLYNSMKERKYEIALIRVLGGGKGKIFLLVVIEGIIVALSGYLIGIILSRIGMLWVSAYTEDNYNYSLNGFGGSGYEVPLLVVSLCIGLIASVLPAIKAMNTDISKTLSR